jgi:hypothetical protein
MDGKPWTGRTSQKRGLTTSMKPYKYLIGKYYHLIVNTTPTPLEVSSSLPVPSDFDTHMAYAAQQRLDGYAEAIRHAMDRKTRFDRRILDSAEGEVVFEVGQLVQIFRSDLAKSISSERKLAPMWSEPHRISERLLNSYKLETLEGQPLDGEYNARRLRKFVPRGGTELATQQKEFEERRIEELDMEGEIVLDSAEKEDSSEGVHAEQNDNTK